MFCITCNQDTGAGNFCPRCGRSFPVVPPQPTVPLMNYSGTQNNNGYASSVIPTYLRVMTWILGGLGVTGTLYQWNQGYSFNVAAMVAVNVLLIVGMVSGHETWCYPMIIILGCDEFAGIFAPIVPSQNGVLPGIITVGILVFMAIKWREITG